MATQRLRIAWIVLLCSFLLFSATSPVAAQSLRFEVESATADVYIAADGTAAIEYSYIFVNSRSGSPIDAVDIGLPTREYSLGRVTATVNGEPITQIEVSPYVDPGVALMLGSRAIPPGERGTVQMRVEGIGSLLYKTNKVENAEEPYASFQFSPNSFGSEFVSGQTNWTITLHLPPGLTDQEPRWFTPEKWPGSDQPTSGIDGQGNVFYQWQAADARADRQYIFGAAFPARLVPAEALVTEPIINVSEDFGSMLCPMVFGLGFVGFLAMVIFGSMKADKNRRMQYLPPKIAMEGLGVKRGLTAVEAAVLLEQPLDKVLTMILFGAAKKGALKVISKEPLKIEKLAGPTADLRQYEVAFIEAMLAPTKGEVRTRLQKMMVELVKTVTEKMRGFSRRETVDYYQEITRRAWGQVTKDGTPEVRMQAFDEAAEWTMLDRNYEDKSREVLTPQTIFLPRWWGNFDPGTRPAAGSAPSTLAAPTLGGNIQPTQVGSAPGSSNLPTLPGGDIAASMAGGIQNFASNVVGDLTSFTSGVTNATNPLPKPSASSSRGGSRGGGGSSCACACACACAGCACACAGGGR